MLQPLFVLQPLDQCPTRCVQPLDVLQPLDVEHVVFQPLDVEHAVLQLLDVLQPFRC